MDITEKIPKFPIWKMFNETIPALLNMDCPEINLQQLTHIVRSKEFPNIFVFEHDPSLSLEEYEEISQKYKGFTAWLLGRFFQLLSCDKLIKMHDLIIDAQLRILLHMSITQSDIYVELSEEYSSALKQLVDYHKRTNETRELQPITIQLFVIHGCEDLKAKLDLNPLPVEIDSKAACIKMLNKVIKFIHKITVTNIELFYFNQITYDNIDDLFYILTECDLNLKLAATEIIADLLKCSGSNSSQIPLKFIEKTQTLINCIEQLLSYVYNNKIHTSDTQVESLEKSLISILKSFKNSENYEESLKRIATFVSFKTSNEELQKISLTQIDTILLSNALTNISMKECVRKALENKYNLLIVAERKILQEIELYTHTKFNLCLNLYQSEISITWNNLFDEFTTSLTVNECYKEDCKLTSHLNLLKKILEMLIRIKFQIRSKQNDVHFFKESDIWDKILTFINHHVGVCGCISSEVEIILQQILIALPLLYVITDITFIFSCFAYPFTNVENVVALRKANKFLSYLAEASKNSNNRQICLQNVYNFICNVSAKFVTTDAQDDQIKQLFLSILSSVRSFESYTLAWKVLQYPSIFVENKRSWLILTLQASLKAQPTSILLVQDAFDLICKSHSQYIEILLYDLSKSSMTTKTVCLTCTRGLQGLNRNEVMKEISQYREYKNSLYTISEISPSLPSNNQNLNDLLDSILLMYKKGNGEDMKLCLCKRLPALLHVNSFHTMEITKLWMRFAGDASKKVRLEFSGVISMLMQDIQEHKSLSKQYKTEVLQMCFEELKELTIRSLQTSDYDLQDTLLKTVKRLFSVLHVEDVPRYIIELLLYFIMVATSKYSWIAINIFTEMAEERNTTIYAIYLQYRKEMCQRIVKLSALNHDMVNYNLSTSLEKISLLLGFFGPKDFITRECRYLLPYFISLTTVIPEVEELIREMANFVETDLSELFTNRYGNIFLHLLMNETDDDFKKSIKYVEKTTGLSGNVLRKQNLQIILNELLLNFHEKRDRVLLALRMLATEDSNSQIRSIQHIPEYLQPKFLGVLTHFDTKLIARHSDKKQVLYSLTELIRFMGPKHVTPLRFKILAMLRTALNLNHDVFPELNCDAWEVFVRNCEIDALGTQLASIFVSVLPLMQHFPQKIENVFRYLIIENEIYLKDYIPDLFFVLELDISNDLCVIIRKHLRHFERMQFKEQLRTFLKYLKHETIDIRVHALKYLKRLLEKNREELDQMILGYNGIDATVVELLNILMLGCHEKENALKLACGECIGELGALEPSHLPREYIQKTKSFIFYITEDTFIVGALNELIRALQAQENTQNMDRFSLAIQEILKFHGISSNSSSPKHNLWLTFTEGQRELMLPLLSSRYTMFQPIEKVEASPIYGSSFGSSFETWICNWMCNLILSIKSNEKSLLQVCVPSLKQHRPTLMYFLPYILLHVLLENDHDVHQGIYEEFITVINSFSNDYFILNDKLTSQSDTAQELKEYQCIKVIFVLLDFLDRWIRERIWERPQIATNNNESHIIKGFLSRFCKLQLARCNYQCDEYPRALMYLEEYINEQPNTFSNHFEFLSKLYAQLDEPDGVAGVTALQTTEPPLEQRILALEVSGKLADAATCYERIHPPLKPYHIQGLVQCYLDLDNANTALNFTKGAIERQPEYENILWDTQAECLWRLGHYNELDDLLKKPELKKNNNGWAVQVGQALLHLKDGNRNEFKTILDSLRGIQVDSLGAASLKKGAYHHGYSYVAKLHTINELQQVERVVHELLASPNDPKVSEMALKQLTSEWELRLKVVQESIRIQEPILCLRRVALGQARNVLQDKVPHSVPLINSLLGELWLYSGKIARTAGVHQQAYTYLLKSEEYMPPRLFLEKAKMHWLREEHEQALTTLNRGLEKLLPEGRSSFSSDLNTLSIENRKIAAEAKLLIATYNDSISNVDTDTNTHHYKEAVEVFPEWEKSMVCLAQYYDRIFQTFSDTDKDAKRSDIQLNMIVYFGKSLYYGTNYVYQSMPRLLSIWFDYGVRLLSVTDRATKKERTNVLLNMTKLIDTFLERLPAYIFLTAFSQLVSRICHPREEVYIELKSIIIKLILNYPQQSLWMIISVIKSSSPVRVKRCAEILNDNQLKTPSMMKLIGDFTKLGEKLIELCNKNISDSVHVASVNSLLRSLPRLLGKDDFSKIMIPTQKFRKLILPNPDFKSSQHNPFPNQYVHIVGIEDEIIILQSLQHPRKITFRGSDGKLYIQMLKARDDLRKDFRLMEFNDIVNQLLSREADSRQRRLCIHLYSVVPLNEECGLIEWVPNLVGLRPIISSLYKQSGTGMSARELKQTYYNHRDSLVKKREIFTKAILPKHPPIFGEWFRQTFPDAQSWLTARTAYIRTTAVISMVGYILGLGDRHGENILFDSTCGDTVHVDFNCLFNKGETLEWPERVPFRLTHNMVGAMGPLGVEGVFRKSCACTLRVLRMNSDTLMSIVTPFVYDPLVSWQKNVLATSNAEVTNEKALEHIQNIKQRLQGQVRTKGRSFSIALSVEGQTNYLIQEAVNIDNLCQMYIGWGPYL